METLEREWQRPLQPTICENCDWSYLITEQTAEITCPHCYKAKLRTLAEEELPVVHPPELLAPFNVPETTVQQNLHDFSRSIWPAPRDLKTETLLSRMRKLYVPAWLVDSDVAALWQAEMGFDYDVVSHQEQFKDGQWHTSERTETKVRWEQRVGRLQRRYDNITAPALEEHTLLAEKLGDFKLTSSTIEGYDPAHIAQTLVRLPNRTTEDAWSDAESQFQKRASTECQKASEAEHVRQFKWTTQFNNQEWTQLLLPLYSTWYIDDEGKAQAVLINGRSGQLNGVKRASMRRAKALTRNLAIIAVILFFIAIALLAYRPAFALLLGTLTFAVGVGAIVPIAYAAQFNGRNQSDMPFAVRNKPSSEKS